MAPRLSRWIALTAVAAALVAVLFLTTGGAPLLFIGYGEFSSGHTVEPTLVLRRMGGVQAALSRVSARRDYLETRRLLTEALRRTAADPVVFRRTGDLLVVDQALTAELQPLWGTLPARRPEIRTAVLLEVDRPGTYLLGRTIDSTGLCVLRQFGVDAAKKAVGAIRSGGGECLFAESFGLPGAGLREWVRGLRSGLAWEHLGRGAYSPWVVDDRDPGPPAWFQVGAADLWAGRRQSPVRRAEMACLAGREGQCEAATGVGTAGWAREGADRGYFRSGFPDQEIPRDLLNAIGPDRFGQVWTSADPIATSYRRATGATLDVWLRDWAERRAGALERDNALSLTGWVGALLWLALFGLLTLERLKQRAVT